MGRLWFRWWLCSIRQQTITWSNVDPDLCRRMASLRDNELTLPWIIFFLEATFECSIYREQAYLSIPIYMHPWCTDFSLGDMGTHFYSFLKIGSWVLPRWKQRLIQSAWLIACFLMLWRHKEPGHQQPWYQPSSTGIPVRRQNGLTHIVRGHDYSGQTWSILSAAALSPSVVKPLIHDDVIKWKHFPRNWPFVREIHRSPVNFPHKGQWRGALMFSLIYARINDSVNNHEAGDLRRQHGHYDVIVMHK